MNPTVVIDSSFLIAAMLEEEHSVYALAVLDAAAEADLLAPGLIYWEYVNALLNKQKKGRMTGEQFSRCLTQFSRLAISYARLPPMGLVRDLLELASTARLTGYDAAYLELAVRERAELATLDEDLAKGARAANLLVHYPWPSNG